jgi:Protein of unknown function (DUF3175)
MAITKKPITGKKITGKNEKSNERWVATVTTASTYPESGLFNKSASAIASARAPQKVSPKGPTSGMRMLSYFINRAGRGLSRERRTELEKARALLSKRIPQNQPTGDNHAACKAA